LAANIQTNESIVELGLFDSHNFFSKKQRDGSYQTKDAGDKKRPFCKSHMIPYKRNTMELAMPAYCLADQPREAPDY
jgi:hypothetical protein